MNGLKDLLVRRLLRERLGCRFRWMIRREQDLWLPEPQPQAKIPLTFRLLTEEDLPLCRRLVGQERLSELQERLRQGHFAFGAFHEGHLAGLSWMNPLEAYDQATGLRFRLKPTEYYIYHKLVDPAFRNLGVGTQITWEFNQTLKAQGFRRKVAFVDIRNDAQWGSSAKMGSKNSGYIIFIQMFGLRFSLSLPMKKAFPFRLRSRKKDGALAGVRGIP